MVSWLERPTGETFDHSQWRTVLLTPSTATEAEVAGACILTEVLNLIFGQTMNVDTVIKCVERIQDEMTKERR